MKPQRACNGRLRGLAGSWLLSLGKFTVLYSYLRYRFFFKIPEQYITEVGDVITELKAEL